MTEWGVFLVISALFAFVAALIAPIIKLNTAIVQLTDSVKRFDEALKELSASNSQTHKRLWERLDAHSEKISEHDVEISVLKEREGIK